MVPVGPDGHGEKTTLPNIVVSPQLRTIIIVRWRPGNEKRRNIFGGKGGVILPYETPRALRVLSNRIRLQISRYTYSYIYERITYQTLSREQNYSNVLIENVTKSTSLVRKFSKFVLFFFFRSTRIAPLFLRKPLEHLSRPVFVVPFRFPLTKLLIIIIITLSVHAAGCHIFTFN